MSHHTDDCGPNCTGFTKRVCCNYEDPCGADDCSRCAGCGVYHGDCPERECGDEDTGNCLHCDGQDDDCACDCHKVAK